MPVRSTEEGVQSFVHAIEAGGLKRWIWTLAAIAGFVTLAVFMLIVRFKGLSEAEGMDQAQIAREVARGNGLVTQYVRPADLYFAARRGENTITEKLPDTYHPPLWPLVNGVVFRFANVESWNFERGNLVYRGDQVVAAVGIVFLLLSFIAAWWLARQLFDERVAWVTVGLMAVGAPFWMFAMSGLSQTMTLFFFLVAMNTFCRATTRHTNGESGTPLWLLLTAVAMGLATLSHGLLFFPMLALLGFVLIAFGKHRFWAVLMALLYLCVLAPWLIRNQMEFGMPLGKGFYTILGGIGPSSGEMFSRLDPNFNRFPLVGLFRKTFTGVVDQFANLVRFQGGLILVPIFFLALLHPFKRPTAALFRWGAALLYFALLFGMGLFGNIDGLTSANQLQILMTPIFVAYAVALMVMLTSRFSVYAKLVRIAMLGVVFFLVMPGFLKMVLFDPMRLHYPPYMPPSISLMGRLTEPQEVVSADIPWAVAWYADRRTLQMPNTPEAFTAISDFRRLGAPIAGLLITPYSANSPLLLDILFGRWRPWAPFISRSNPDLRNFPCPVPTTLPPDNQYLGLFDRKRWD